VETLETLNLGQDLKDTLQDRLERSIAEAEGLFCWKISSLWGEGNLESILNELGKYDEPIDKIEHALDERFKQFARKVSLDKLSNKNEDLADYIIYLMRRTHKAISLSRHHFDICKHHISIEDINVFLSNAQLTFYLLGSLQTLIETNNISNSLLNKVASKGGFARAEKYREKMNPIFDEAFNLFTQNNPKTGTRWNSKKECANFFIRNFYKNNPDTDIDLDAKKIVQEITNRLNNLYASKRVNMLVK
jgi:hypothetical protein